MKMSRLRSFHKVFDGKRLGGGTAKRNQICPEEVGIDCEKGKRGVCRGNRDGSAA